MHNSVEDLRLFRIENIEKPISPINQTLLQKHICIPTLKPENFRNDGNTLYSKRKTLGGL